MIGPLKSNVIEAGDGRLVQRCLNMVDIATKLSHQVLSGHR